MRHVVVYLLSGLLGVANNQLKTNNKINDTKKRQQKKRQCDAVSVYSIKIEREAIMARGINKVILVGNLGGDPEVRYMPNGNAVTNVTLATSDSWNDKETGQKQERTEWHRVVFFGKIAEIAGEYLRKGSQIYVEGALRTRKWQDQSGNDRYTTEIVVDMKGTMQMLGGQQQGQQQAAPQPQQQRPQPAPAQPQQPAPGVDDFDDDIPF